MGTSLGVMVPGQGGSYVYRPGATAQTEAVLSTRFRIMSYAAGQKGLTLLGVTSAFNVSEQRNVETIRGLGFGDVVAELVPGVTAPLSLSVTRTALYLANLMQVLGYNAGASGLVRSLRHHKWPFDIRTEILFSQVAQVSPQAAASPDTQPADNNPQDATAASQQILSVATLYTGCWMESYSSDFAVETAAVAENCTILVTDITDSTGTFNYGEFIDSGLGPDDSNTSLLFPKV